MNAPEQLDFYFDIGSPYSYLSAHRVEAFGERLGLEVQWVPFLLGGVFQAVGNDMPARIKPKGDWLFRDVTMQAKRQGVPFRMSSHFPINSIRPQRALVAAGRLHGQAGIRGLAMPLFDAYWAEDRDVSKPEELVAVANRAGLNGEMIAEMCGDPEVKQELIDITAAAVERGAFGAPTFVIRDQLFWGNDRFDLMEWYLRDFRR